MGEPRRPRTIPADLTTPADGPAAPYPGQDHQARPIELIAIKRAWRCSRVTVPHFPPGRGESSPRGNVHATRGAPVTGARSLAAAGDVADQQGPHDALVSGRDPCPQEAGEWVALLHEGGEQQTVPVAPEQQLARHADARASTSRTKSGVLRLISQPSTRWAERAGPSRSPSPCQPRRS